MPFQYDLSCIVISYNSAEFISDNFKSIINQKYCSFELIVIDNGSNDSSAETIKNLIGDHRFPNFDFIQNTENIGFGKAANIAASRAKGEYLFILNPDTAFNDDIFFELVKFARSTGNIGLISPLLISTDGSIQLSARRLPSRMDLLKGRGSPLFKLGIFKEAGAGYLTPSGDNPFEVQAVSGTAVLIPTAVFREVSGFDERFFMYMEDLDLCLRLRQLGKKIWMLPDIKVKHLWRKSSSSRPYFSMYHQYLSVHRYFSKHYPQLWLTNLFYLIFLLIGFITNCMLIFVSRRLK